MYDPDEAPTGEDPEFGAGFTLIVILGPVGFFAFYLLAAYVPGSDGWVGPLLLALFAAGVYMGMTMLGTYWFRDHRNGRR